MAPPRAHSKAAAVTARATLANAGFKTNYVRADCIESFFTGGAPLAVFPNTLRPFDEHAPSPGSMLLATNYGEDVILTAVDTGRAVRHLSPGHDSVTCIAATQDGKFLFAATQNLMVSVYDLSKIRQESPLDRFKEDTAAAALAAAAGKDAADDEYEDDSKKKTAGTNGAESKDENALFHSFKAHSGPVLVMDTDPTNTLLATGAADSTVRVWDIEGKFCTHIFRGHQGIISCVKFMTEPVGDAPAVNLLVSGSDADCSVRVWDLNTKQQVFHLDGHASVVRAIDFTPDLSTLITAGRDKVINVWDISDCVNAIRESNKKIGEGNAVETTSKSKKSKKKSKNASSSTTALHFSKYPASLKMTIPTLETTESLSVLSDIDVFISDKSSSSGTVVCTAGSRGILRLWNLQTGEVILAQEDLSVATKKTNSSGHDDSLSQYTQMIYLPDIQQFVCVTSDQNILLVGMNSDDDFTVEEKATGFRVIKAFAGYNQEILDVTFVNQSSIPGFAQFKAIENKSHDSAGDDDDAMDVESMGEIEDLGSEADDDTLVIGENVQVIGNLSDPAVFAQYKSQLGITDDDELEKLKQQVASAPEPSKIKREKMIEAFDRKKLEFSVSERVLAVATNTEQLRIYDLKTMECELLYGHSAIIMCVASSNDGEFIATGSKDHKCIIWRRLVVYPQDEEPKIKYVKFGECIGHTDPVSAIAFSNFDTSKINEDPNMIKQMFLVTGSHDRTVKVWDIGAPYKESLGNKTKRSNHNIQSILTFRAHEKDIQSVAVSPNNKLLASGGLDKFAKVWSSEDGKLIGTCKGHKRGLWTVAFSPVDQILATSSTDKTIKLWALSDFACVKTFEGHLNTVLRVEFIANGMQLLTCGSDGLMKLWDVRSNECIKTIDAHEDRIWAMAISKNENRVATGSSDSQIFIWRDFTSEEVATKNKQQELRIQLEQDLSNSVKARNWNRAIAVALELEDKIQLLKLFRELPALMDAGDESGIFKRLKYGEFDEENENNIKDVDSALCSFRSVTSDKQRPIVFGETMDKLLLNLSKRKFRQLVAYVVDWNKVSSSASLAQRLLRLFVTTRSSRERLSECLSADQLASLITYTDRHFVTATERMRSLKLLDYTVARMSATGTAE